MVITTKRTTTAVFSLGFYLGQFQDPLCLRVCLQLLLLLGARLLTTILLQVTTIRYLVGQKA